MLAVGDRVKHKNTDDYGTITKPGRFTNEWLVAWEYGACIEHEWTVESELAKVDVTVLEGPVYVTMNGAVQVGDTYLEDVVVPDEVVRITIERVVKEG